MQIVSVSSEQPFILKVFPPCSFMWVGGQDVLYVPLELLS